MPLKIVLFYNQGSEGFTETYYSPSTAQPFDYLNGIALPRLYPLVAFRHSSVSLYAIRATLLGANRVSSTYFLPVSDKLSGTFRNNPDGVDPPLQGADVSSTDAYCQITGELGASRPLYVRGLNDPDVIRNGILASTPSPNLVKGLASMQSALIALSWAIQKESRPPTAPLIWALVGTVAPLGTNTSRLTLNVAIPNLVVGTSQVVFQGIPKDDIPGFPRIVVPFAATVVAPFTLDVAYTFRGKVDPYIPAKMKVCLVINTYDPITVLRFARFGERKTGRAFGVPRGRSRAAVRAI